MMQNRALYPVIVGLLLGVLQTGLYFQLSFTLSSGFGTYLMVTLGWLSGSLLGVLWLTKQPLSTRAILLIALAAYGLCSLLLVAFPFNLSLFPVYALLIVIIGLYPGVFFARASRHSLTGVLFFRENNGFIAGLLLGTLLFMIFGRLTLWLPPLLLVGYLWFAEAIGSRESVSS